MKFFKKNWLFIALGAMALYFLCSKKSSDKVDIVLPANGDKVPKPFDFGVLKDVDPKGSMVPKPMFVNVVKETTFSSANQVSNRR